MQIDRWKLFYAADVITSLERDISPHLGSMPMEEIHKPVLLAVLQKIEARGAIDTARRVKQRAAIYCFANAEGAKLENPAVDINDALKPFTIETLPRARRCRRDPYYDGEY